jgi:hypothetical protein
MTMLKRLAIHSNKTTARVSCRCENKHPAELNNVTTDQQFAIKHYTAFANQQPAVCNKTLHSFCKPTASSLQ